MKGMIMNKQPKPRPKWLSYVREVHGGITIFRDPEVPIIPSTGPGVHTKGSYWSLDEDGWHGPARTMPAAANMARPSVSWMTRREASAWMPHIS